MGRSKAKTLYWIWKKYSDLGWGEKLKEVGVVTQEDINGFLRLVKERDDWWEYWELGYFVSLVLGCCYGGWFIELDVNLVDGEIDVGYQLGWGGILYVKGDVKGDVGNWMEKGKIVVEGNVDGNVGYLMEDGVIVVEGNVSGDVGYVMGGGIIIVNGVIKQDKRLAWIGKGFVVYKGFVYTGRWSE